MDLAKLHLHWRVSQYKGKRYRSYSLARAYRENGKNGKEIVLKLGKLSEQEVRRWRYLLAALKKPEAFVATLDELVVTHHYAYLDVAVVNAVWEAWELEAAFPATAPGEVGSALIARLLTLNRCLEPAAKSQIPDWFEATTLPWLLEVEPRAITPYRVFHELEAIELHKEALCRHVFGRLQHDDPEALKTTFYDLSSTTFSGSRCVLMKWGHCKEGYRNHAVLALVVNGQGLPFYWEVLPGGTADSKTIQWLLAQLHERFKLVRTTVVFDRGMVSEDNLSQLEAANIHYITALDRNQLEATTGLDFSGFGHLEPSRVSQQAGELEGFTSLDDTLYYRDLGSSGARRFILCFNPGLFQEQRRAREQAVATFQVFVESLNGELQAAKKSRQQAATYEKFKRQLHKAKLSSFVDVSLQEVLLPGASTAQPIRTYHASVEVDEAAMRNTGRLDGFWLLVTNHTETVNQEFTLSAPEAIRPYRDKSVIESAFRDIKSFVEVKPVYVWTPAHVKAHYTCCVLAYLINRTLTLRLHRQPGQSTNAVVAHEKLYNKLAACQINQITVEPGALSTYTMTRPTHEHEELLARIGLTHLLAADIVKKMRLHRQT